MNSSEPETVIGDSTEIMTAEARPISLLIDGPDIIIFAAAEALTRSAPAQTFCAPSLMASSRKTPMPAPSPVTAP